MQVLIRFHLLILLICILSGCKNSSNQVIELKKENRVLRQEIDSLKKLIDVADSVKTDTDTKAATETQQSASSNDRGLRIGKHDFTLQWISWNEPGSVNIQIAENGWYSIKGGQKSSKNSDYITINGLIKQVSASELLFKGEIKSVIQSNNGGKPCIKTGKQLFKTTKNRKYWRLQDMINCEGGMLTDYVDIYF